MAPDFILTAELSTCDRSYGPQNLKYLLTKTLTICPFTESLLTCGLDIC